jgi:hypothetical protein
MSRLHARLAFTNDLYISPLQNTPPRLYTADRERSDIYGHRDLTTVLGRAWRVGNDPAIRFSVLRPAKFPRHDTRS